VDRKKNPQKPCLGGQGMILGLGQNYFKNYFGVV
jgi:hypothetical protein